MDMRHTRQRLQWRHRSLLLNELGKGVQDFTFFLKKSYFSMFFHTYTLTSATRRNFSEMNEADEDAVG